MPNDRFITIQPAGPKQHEAWLTLEDRETTDFLFGGGAGGGKTFLGCDWLIAMCLRYDDTRYFIARKTLKNLKKTTLRTFFKVAKVRGLKQGEDYVYQEQQSVITFPQTGSAIDLLEVALNPSDPEFEDLGSSEYTSGWIEEAGEVAFEAYDTLKSRIGRQNNDKYGILGKIFITCNPKKNWLYTTFYKPWKNKILPKGYKFLQSLVDDNPKNEKGYKQNLINIKSIAKKQRLLFGNWEYDDDPNTLMQYDALTDLFSNSISATNEKWCIVDVARYGRDTTVFALWRGLDWYDVRTYEKQGTDQTEEKLKELLRQEQIPYSHCLVDEDGVGGGVVDHLRGVKGFVANRTPFPNKITGKPDGFRGLKAQCAYLLSELVNSHKIKISWDEKDLEDRLIEELEQVKKKDPDNELAKRDIIPKEEVKEAIGRSPDLGDTMIMRMFFEFEHPTETIKMPDPITIMLNKHKSNQQNNGTTDYN